MPDNEHVPRMAWIDERRRDSTDYSARIVHVVQYDQSNGSDRQTGRLTVSDRQTDRQTDRIVNYSNSRWACA